MIIMTARHGEVDIDPAKIISLGDGVIGFPNFKRYVFLPFMEGTEFELFQAVDHPGLGFVVVDPFLFDKTYLFQLTDQDQEELQAKSQNDLLIRVIVTIPEDPRLMTANMQGPLVINKNRLLGKQVVLSDPSYETKHRVFSDD